MAQDKDHIKSNYPLPAFSYRVTIIADAEPIEFSFAEVSGLSVEYEPVTYKHGFSFVMGSKIIPGMRQPITLSMSRGIVQNRDQLNSWLSDAYGNPFSTTAKRDILIDLCDEEGQPVVRWTVKDALPTKLDAPTFDADSNDVAIESIEFIAHDLKIEHNP